MQRPISTKKRSMVLCALLLGTVFVSLGFAQSETAPEQQPFLVYDVQVKPGMGPEFENLIKNDIIPALKKAGDTTLYTSRTEFGQADSYRLAIPIKSIAQLDAPGSLEKAMGEKGMAYLILRLNELTYSPRIYMINGRSDLGLPWTSGYEPKLQVLVTNTVAPGRTADYEKNAKAMIAVFKKTSVKGVLAAKVGIGDNPNKYMTLLFFDSFADMQNFIPPFQKAMAEAKLSSQAGIVTHTEITLVRPVAELSYTPASQ